MSELRLFTSESVTEGHPDKVCDQISDAILDALLEQDPASRVAVETMVTTGLVHVAGEVTTEAYVEIPQIVRDVVRGIGYTSSTIGFDADSCGVSVSIGQQSPDIAQGVDKALEMRDDTSDLDPLDAQGAGDQGLMFGYASDETPSLMPVAGWLAHRLSERLASVRKTGEVLGLRPDGKTQVTVGYDGDRPVAIDTVVLSTQHDADVLQEKLHAEVAEHVIAPVLESAGLEWSGAKQFVNPTGKFVIGGPQGDGRACPSSVAMASIETRRGFDCWMVVSVSDSRRLVAKLVAGSNVLRDSGVNMYEYTEQLTYLLFLKMAEERATRPLNPERVVPDEFAWHRLLGLSGEALEDTYNHILRGLAASPVCSVRCTGARRTRSRTRPTSRR